MINKVCSRREQNTKICLQNKNSRNGKIEFLRFVFAVIIVISHSRAFLGDISPFKGGALGVEFFFFVSGYLMMVTIEKKNMKGKPECVGKETLMYIKKKWITVIPESLISWMIAFCLMCIVEGRTASSAFFRFIDGIWEPVFITMTGLGQRGMNGVVWYISAMLLSMAILYPLLRKYLDVTIHLIIPLVGLCVFGCFFRNFGSPRSPTEWLGWTYKGVLRAFAELGIGCLLYYLSKQICVFNFTSLGRCVISVTENICYLIVIVYMYLMDASRHDYFFIALLAFAVALTFSSSGIDSNFFNNKIVLYLGRFSVPLYFSHTFWADAFKYLLPATWRIRYRLVVYFIVSTVTALLVMWMANVARKYLPTICAGIKSLLVKPTTQND